MAANPQVVNVNCTMVWDGVKTNLLRGQVIDVPAGSAQMSATTYVPPGSTSNSAALSTRVTAMTAQQQVPGSSDSVSPASLATQQAGGGVDPYNSGQEG
jgi:hypothetical protein